MAFVSTSEVTIRKFEKFERLEGIVGVVGQEIETTSKIQCFQRQIKYAIIILISKRTF